MKRLLCLAFAGATACAPVFVQSATPSTQIGVPRGDSLIAQVVVDGRTGSVGTNRAFGLAAPVRVVVTNVNPYLFQYRIQTANHTITEANPADFFRIAFGLTLPSGTPPAPSTQSAFETQGTSSPLKAAFVTAAGLDVNTDSATCAVATSLINQDRAKVERLEAAHIELYTALRSTRDTVNAVDSTYRLLVDTLYDATADANTLQRVGSHAERLLRSTAGLMSAAADSLNGSYGGFAAQVARLIAEITPTEQTLRGCGEDPDLVLRLSRVAHDTALFKAGVDSLNAKSQQAVASATNLARINRDPSRFYLTTLLPRSDGPSDITVRVQRHVSADTSYQTFSETRINFGGTRRFSIGAGLAFSPFAIHDFAALKERVVPSAGQPGDTIVVRLVDKEASRYRVAPMLTLNTRLFQVQQSGGLIDGLHLSLGAGLRAPADDRDLQYLAGLGVSGFDQRVLVVVGGYGTRETFLLSGHTTGEELPSTGDLPIRKRFRVRFGTALTFRLW